MKKKLIEILLLVGQIQPVKEWQEIQSYEYKEDDSRKFVEFRHGGINRLHNVRVVNLSTSDVSFNGDCKFTDGEATLEEGWSTKSDVENGLARWEVELKDGG
jgi:hypothetical protein